MSTPEQQHEQHAEDPARVAALERKLATLEKINQALIGRVERSTDSIGDSYSMFIHNLTLQRYIEKRTHDLQENNKQLQNALFSLQDTTEQMIQSEKLAALRSLVAGIAHEVNTPLGISVTAASYLEESTRALAAVFAAGTIKKSDLTNFIASNEETVQILLSNLRRAADLVQSFKNIAVDQSSETWQTVALKVYLSDIIASLAPTLKKTKIKVSIQCPETLRINTMPGALSQILINLVTNSLTHGFDEEQEGEIVITVKIKKRNVTITYADNGKGIARENISKVFEPFYTTARGKGGSGLGMHIVYNLVTRSLKGDIAISSEPDEGVRLTISLPDSVLADENPNAENRAYGAAS